MLYKKNKFILIVLCSGVFLITPFVLMAEFGNPFGGNDSTFYDVLVAILNSTIHILYPVLVLMVVYTGFLFIKAQGNPSELQKARQALLWTVIGGLIILGSVALAEIVKNTATAILP